MSFLAALASLLAPAPARASLVVSVGNVSIEPGNTRTLDIYMASTATAQAPDQINNYAFTLQIKNLGVDNTQLAFAPGRNSGYLTAPNASTPYVFSGDSFDAQSVPPSAGSAGQTVYPGDTFIGTDSTASGNSVSLSAGQTYLLASLTLTAATNAPPIAGDSFSIGLSPTSGDGSLNGGSNTYFDVFDLVNGVETSATPYASTSGSANIGVASVPEPPSLVLESIALVIVALVWGASGNRRPRFA